DANDQLLGVFGAFGTGPGQFAGDVAGLAVDSSGDVYAADTSGRRVVVFSRTGASVGQWDIGADATWMGGLAIDPGDRVHVVVGHAGGVGVRRFTTDGTFLDEVAFRASSGSLPLTGTSLAIDGVGDLLVRAPGALPIAVYTPHGEPVTSIGENEVSFAVDVAGDVYV